jgi:hypothetical protein
METILNLSLFDCLENVSSDRYEPFRTQIMTAIGMHYLHLQLCKVEPSALFDLVGREPDFLEK